MHRPLIVSLLSATGWNAPPSQQWLTNALERASRAHYGKPMAAMGEGGTIPFMAMLGARFPRAQFLITGVKQIPLLPGIAVLLLLLGLAATTWWKEGR